MIRHINIAVITPSPVVLAGLTSILSRLDGMNVSIHSADTDEIESLVATHRVSAIIIDVLAGHIDEIERIHSSADDDNVQFILFTSVRLLEQTMRVFDATIGLYDTEDEMRGKVAAAIRDNSSHGVQAELTQREREIVISVVKGLSNKEIATQMNVSVNTVMTHRRNIAAKLHIHSAAGLTIYAITTHLVNLDEI